MKVNGQPDVPRRILSKQSGPKDTISSEPEAFDTFQSSQQSFPSCIIQGEETLSPEQRQFIRSTIDGAVDFFAKNFGEVNRPLVLVVHDTKRALRTGYSVTEDSINFPPDDTGARPGLKSKDILVHEAFHALVAQAYPHHTEGKFSRNREYVRLHEGLADYFTHLLYPDNEFAEGLGEDGKSLRKFRNSRRISLSPGGHSQGNAITSYLLENKIEPSQVRSFLEGEHFTLQALGQTSPELEQALKHDASLSLKDKVSNYPASSLRKYRLEQGKALEVKFEPNKNLKEAHPNLQIEWLTSSGMPSQTFTFEEVKPFLYSISPRTEEGAEKVLAVFRDGEEIIGSRPYYLGTQD